MKEHIAGITLTALPLVAASVFLFATGQLAAGFAITLSMLVAIGILLVSR